MKLGVCYMLFDGEELLEFAASSIRSQVDHISVTYQTTSYFGNLADPELKNTLEKLLKVSLIDEMVCYEPNLSLHPKQNELNLRNLGLELSRRAGCTHHISADVDEFYDCDQLKFAKENIGDVDFSVALMENYYKDPTWMVSPSQNFLCTFIHPVSNSYERTEHRKFPVSVEETRRFSKYDRFKFFDKKDFVIHHMSYIRKDIRKKFANSCNGKFYQMDKFLSDFDKHQVGDRVCLLPDFLNRRTILVENKFGIKV